MKKWFEKIARFLLKLAGRPYPDATRELPSQTGFISNIEYQPEEGRIILGGLGADLMLQTVADTNSMDGLVDAGDTCIFAPAAPYLGRLQVGDIIIFDPYYRTIDGVYHPTKYIMHRIIETGEKPSGRWYRTRGDNTALEDPYLLQDRNIRYLLGGVLYKPKEA